MKVQTWQPISTRCLRIGVEIFWISGMPLEKWSLTHSSNMEAIWLQPAWWHRTMCARIQPRCIFYVKEAGFLPPLLSRVVHGCIQKECKTLIVDLINEQRSYEDVYRSLGFVKSADWAVYEKELWTTFCLFYKSRLRVIWYVYSTEIITRSRD